MGSTTQSSVYFNVNVPYEHYYEVKKNERVKSAFGTLIDFNSILKDSTYIKQAVSIEECVKRIFNQYNNHIAKLNFFCWSYLKLKHAIFGDKVINEYRIIIEKIEKIKNTKKEIRPNKSENHQDSLKRNFRQNHQKPLGRNSREEILSMDDKALDELKRDQDRRLSDMQNQMRDIQRLAQATKLKLK